MKSGKTVWSILRRADFSSDGDHYEISGSEEESELFGDVVARESVLSPRMIIVLCLKTITPES